MNEQRQIKFIELLSNYYSNGITKDYDDDGTVYVIPIQNCMESSTAVYISFLERSIIIKHFLSCEGYINTSTIVLTNTSSIFTLVNSAKNIISDYIESDKQHMLKYYILNEIK